MSENVQGAPAEEETITIPVSQYNRIVEAYYERAAGIFSAAEVEPEPDSAEEPAAEEEPASEEVPASEVELVSVEASEVEAAVVEEEPEPEPEPEVDPKWYQSRKRKK